MLYWNASLNLLPEKYKFYLDMISTIARKT